MNCSFERLAIVNRGEPAMRLLHAVREIREQHGLALSTIALYTEPDRQSMFVREADHAVLLGPATFVDPRDGERKSKYLDYEALRRALVESGAQAAWVGWGFVSEHAEFADLCKELGIIFVGPDGDVMRKVGDKIASKLLAEGAGVPVSPWTGGPVETVEEALVHAERIGFPLMIKATAGGGGRGVRRIKSCEELADAFRSAKAEALKFFGSGTVFLEKAIVGARHVEVQVLADTHDTCWAVGVRDCTIQRRNQKVLEEAPCPVLDPALDRQVREAAVRLSRAARYVNAGTVEFLFDVESRAFYFMEMNTRLQVEHPVTEATTGIDLVKMQLHIASGGRLEGPPPVTTGHAIELRLNAEDADNQFAPAPGRVELWNLPTGPGLRVDTGVTAGDVIAPDFDSMIAKLIAFGKTREEAISRLRRALVESGIVIRGGTSNKAFLLELLAHPDVLTNRTDIGWLDRVRAEATADVRPYATVALIQAALDVYDAEFALERKNFFVSASRGRPTVRSEIGRSIDLRYAGQSYKLETRCIGPNQYRVYVEGRRIDVSVDRRGEYERWLTCGRDRHRVLSVVDGVQHRVEVDGIAHKVSCDDGGVVRAPAPAVVLAVHVKPDATVKMGDRLVVLEAMKMETAVVAPCAGRVRKVMVRPNIQVVAGAPLVALEPSEKSDDQGGADRLTFQGEADVKSGGLTYQQMLLEVRRAMLGYDIDANESESIRRGLSAARETVPAFDSATWSSEAEVLRIFADLLAVYHDEPLGAFEQRMSGEETFHQYLRSVKSAGKGFAPSFVEKLRRAVSHYGVEQLEPSAELDRALVCVHKAHNRFDICASHAFAVLESWVKHADTLAEHATAGVRELLDALVVATQDSYLSVNDLARQARFCFFDRTRFEKEADQGVQKVRELMRSILEIQKREDLEPQLEELAQSGFPLHDLLSSSMTQQDPATRRIAVEVVLRRYYRTRKLSSIRFEQRGRQTLLSADYRVGDGNKRVVATHANYSELEVATKAASEFLADEASREPVSLDLYVAYEGVLGVEEMRKTISDALHAAEFRFKPECVSVVLLGLGRGNPLRCFTFVPREDGSYGEHPLYPGMHPMMAERLEVWRLRNFKIEQLPAPEHIYIFHAKANDNPKDERLFAFVDVRDVSARRDESDNLLELPQLEHLMLEALAGIREVQARRSARDRLLWNRVVLFLWQVVDFSPADVKRIAKRLLPSAKNLGLEKAVIRMKTREGGGQLVERALHVSNRVGTGLRIHLQPVSDEPLRPIDAYAQKVVQLRRLSLVYPYEIVRMLTPARHSDHAEFAPGDFVEYDLDEQKRLVPVDRPFGRNQANVVVGVIRNYTPKHPEGMARVILLGDPSREMGALSDPECDRIIAAFDLAEQMRLPVDWFPVSSGAKIAMDVGTEALDAVAHVLRRVVEFTQKGGEANVIVAGVNVGAQSYWDAEATMLMHTRGILVMTPPGSMVLTGKRALDYSGGVSAETNQGIGGFERIMGPNGQAQYCARDLAEACHILFRHYEHSYVAPDERFPRRTPTTDAADRDVCASPHAAVNGTGFETVGDVFSLEKNPGRKKPFDIRSVMRAVIDQDQEPFERWLLMRNAETAVTWDAHLGGIPICLIGVESKPLARFGFVPGDGPDSWTGGTLFPQSSKKVARAINGASGNRPVVVLANLSGFDGSPESMRDLQLEYGAEIGRAVVNFDGPIVFCVISRYHGGAYVVFSCTLNENLHVVAVEGSHASVIGGAPAAAVVFPAEVKARTLADPRIKEIDQQLRRAEDRDKARVRARYDEAYKIVFSEKQGEVAEYFDRVHSVQRAKDVGSLHAIVPAATLRPYLIGAVEAGMARVLAKSNSASLRR